MLQASEALSWIEARDVEMRAFVEFAASASPTAAAVAVKDLFRVDGFLTRAGPTLAPEVLAGVESDVVRRLRNADFAVVGKTAMAGTESAIWKDRKLSVDFRTS